MQRVHCTSFNGFYISCITSAGSGPERQHMQCKQKWWTICQFRSKHRLLHAMKSGIPLTCEKMAVFIEVKEYHNPSGNHKDLSLEVDDHRLNKNI